MKKGLVSVIIAVHDEKEEFLRMALESIFNQTYPNIEIIIIDDNSDERCKHILNEICKDKRNVLVIHNKENIGLTKSLNKGLELASGEFVARMDADDVSVRDRFSKQVDFLNDNPNIDIVGTGVVSFGKNSVFMSPAFGYTNEEAQCNLFFSSTLCHPSVMMRKEFLEKNSLKYDENVKKGQDYDLWERASIKGRMCVLSEVLLYYRTHPKQISSIDNKEQVTTAEMVRKRRIKRLGIIPNEKEYRCHELLAGGIDNTVSFYEIRTWAEKLFSQNMKTTFVSQHTLHQNLKTRLLLTKLRNPTYRKLINVKDLPALLSLVFNRIRLRVKLSIVRRNIIKAV